MAEKEKWKPIEKYDNLYLISSKGNVFSIRTQKLLKIQSNNKGYKRVEINVNGRHRKESIHRLVAEAFIPNPDNLPFVNHKDENPSNNRVENLEWCTPKYNSNYGTCIERRLQNTKYMTGSENAKSKKVYQFDLQGNLLNEYGSVREAARLTDLSNVSITKCCNGKLKQYAGFGWSYTKEYHYNDVFFEKFKKGAFLMYDLDGNFIRRFDNSKEMKDAGFNQISANRVARGERKSYKGFVFKHEGVQ